MRTWLLSRWDALRGSFWFVPLLMVVAAAGLSLLTLATDRRAARSGVDLSPAWTFARGPEGSRALLATVAGSMLTIAGVCFSITVVALQQASTQFGPRLLYNFMRDRGNQVVLGTFIAAFTYCLLVLRTVNGTDDGRFVPHLSVTVGLVLGLAGVGVLIYFVHHAAASLQAEHVIATVGRDLSGAVGRLFPERIGAEEPGLAGPVMPDGFATAVPVPAAASDYLRAVDGDGLLRLAVEHDLVLELAHRPGQFVVQGNPLLRAWPPDRVTGAVAADLRGAFILGARRTLFQDVEFAFDQLVEVALRALSPGVNDPFTAMACVDRLTAALCELAGRRLPSPFRRDETGRLRVVAAGVDPAGVTDAALHQIRQAARTNAAVTLRLLDALAAIGLQTRATPFRDPLLVHAALIHQGSQEGLPADADREAARNRYQAVLAAFEAGPTEPSAAADDHRVSRRGDCSTVGVPTPGRPNDTQTEPTMNATTPGGADRADKGIDPPKKGEKFRCGGCGMEIQVTADCKCQAGEHVHFHCCGREMEKA